MSLRAVVFDYGNVLTGPQDQAAHTELIRRSGLTHDRFEDLYWSDRLALDRGDLTGFEFWQNFARDANLKLSDQEIHDLNSIDVQMWLAVNPRMVAWQQKLKEHGLKTAILSNMGENVLAALLASHAWIDNFTAHTWSYQLGIVKPEAAIYHDVLHKLGTHPEETLFIDDKPENIEAAHALGIRGLVFTTPDQLRADLIAAGLDKELPLP